MFESAELDLESKDPDLLFPLKISFFSVKIRHSVSENIQYYPSTNSAQVQAFFLKMYSSPRWFGISVKCQNRYCD